jgi:hypothetical protein
MSGNPMNTLRLHESLREQVFLCNAFSIIYGKGAYWSKFLCYRLKIFKKLSNKLRDSLSLFALHLSQYIKNML